ncbi:hypothetical protein [Nocardia ninae]|nr:hypothetical protein [Nocardia ninae]
MSERTVRAAAAGMTVARGRGAVVRKRTVRAAAAGMARVDEVLS